MTTSPPVVRRHLDGLDGIRALAAGLVLLYHYFQLAPFPLPEPLAVVVRGGWSGVDVFFAISGFILFLPFARAAWTGGPVEVRRYLRNRALRVVPAYWFNLFVLVLALSPALLFTSEGWWRIATNASFAMGYLPPPDQYLVNKVAWTLCIEVGFYLLLPLVARGFVGDRWRVALPVTLVLTLAFKALAIRYYASPTHHDDVQAAIGTIFGTFDQFAMGMVAAAVWARLEHRGTTLPRALGPALALGSLAGGYGVLYVLQHVLAPGTYWDGSGPLGWAPLLLAKPLLSAFAAMAVFGICYQPSVVTRLFSLRPVAYVGVVSYGVYLWHVPVGQWLVKGMSDADVHAYRAPLLLALGAALTVLVAAFSHRFVEQPFLRRKSPAVPRGPERPVFVPIPRDREVDVRDPEVSRP